MISQDSSVAADRQRKWCFNCQRQTVCVLHDGDIKCSVCGTIIMVGFQ